MNPKLTLVQKTIRLPYLIPVPAWVEEEIRKLVNKEIRELEIEMYCEIAGISREEYALQNRFPSIFNAPPDILDMDFEDE